MFKYCFDFFANEGPHDDSRTESSRIAPSNRPGYQLSRNNILLPGSGDGGVNAGEERLHHAHGDKYFKDKQGIFIDMGQFLHIEMAQTSNFMRLIRTHCDPN